MSEYYFSKIVDSSLEDAVNRTTGALKEQGFGVLTQIDLKQTFYEKLGVSIRPYRILGACNPQFAYRALLAEDKIGTMLPCNVIVQEAEDGRVEVAAVDPIASMQAIENEALEMVAQQVRERLKAAIASL